MSGNKGQINDILNLIVGGGIAIFATLFGSSLLINLFLEKNKAETFLVLIGFGLFFCGVGCAVYCVYVLKKRIYKMLYRISLILTAAGFVSALIALLLYERN